MLNRAHIVGRGARGDDIAANIIPLCGSGTAGCHAAFDGQQPVTTYPSRLRGVTSEQVRSVVVSGLRIEERNYVVLKKGEEWLSSRLSA